MPSRWVSIGRALLTAFEEESRNTVLLTPILLLIGVSLYFSKADEPPMTLAIAGLVGCCLAGIVWARYRRWIVPLAILILGFLVAQIHTHAMSDQARLDVPLPEAAERYYADVSAVEKRLEGGWRLHLTALQIPGKDHVLPKHVRIIVRTDIPETIKPGDRVRVRAVLTPLPRPIAPGSFDFGRQLFLKGYGATGFAVSSVEVVQSPQTNSVSHFISAVRLAVQSRILGSDPTQEDAVAAALLTGDRSALSNQTRENYRAAGLSHLLAISGLHMGLVAATVFLFLRRGGALINRVALCLPLKSICAGLTIGAIAAYVALVGSPISAQRAAIMATVVMIGVMVDRRAISLRSAALAAALLILMRPANVLDIGFQMSFMAVVVLIAGYRSLSALTTKGVFGVQSAWVRAIGGVFISTILAELAVLPLSVYHFSELSFYGLFGNALAVPLTAFFIMPAGLISLALMPIGLEGLTLEIMRLGIGVINWLAADIGARPGALMPIAKPAPLPVLTFTAGLLWICISRTHLRWAGAAGCLLSAPFLFIAEPESFLFVNERGTVIAARDEAGALVALKGRGSGFAADVIAREAGTQRLQRTQPGQVQCDSVGCSAIIAHRGGRAGRLITSMKGDQISGEQNDNIRPQDRLLRLDWLSAPFGLRQSCAYADVIIVPFAQFNPCTRGPLVLDETLLRAMGPISLSFTHTNNENADEKPLDAEQFLHGETDGKPALIIAGAFTLKITPSINPSRPWHARERQAENNLRNY